MELRGRPAAVHPSWDSVGHSSSSSSSGSGHTSGGGAHHTEVEVTIVGDHHDPPAGKEAMTSQLGGRARGERWYGLDWIRFICIFYVVFGHTYKISQYEAGGWRDKDEQHEPGLYIYRAVSLGYHWCVPMLFFISGISMSIGVNSHLRKQREKERAMAFFHTALPTAREKVVTHLGLVLASCWRLSHLLAIGVLFNIIRCEVAPIEWGGEHSPIYTPEAETEWEYKLRFWAWLFDFHPEKGGFVRAGLFGIIGSQWYTLILMAFIALTLPLVMWIKDPPESADKSQLFAVLGGFAGASALALLCLTPMDLPDIAYFVAGLFVPMMALAAFMYWPHRCDLRLGFFAFVALSWVLCIRKPDPKGKFFYLQFFIFFVVGIYTGEFKSKLFDEHNTFFVFRDGNKMFVWLVFVFWNVFPILFESMLSSIRGPYPIHKHFTRRIGSMAGTWMVVVCLLGAAFRFVNAPMVPFLYDHLYRLGLWLFVSHTLVLTLCWKYLWIPMGLSLMARFFLGCHVTILLTIALVKLGAGLEAAFKRRMLSAADGSKPKGLAAPVASEAFTAGGRSRSEAGLR